MRAVGRRIDDEVLAHISPAHSENINFYLDTFRGSWEGRRRVVWSLTEVESRMPRCAWSRSVKVASSARSGCWMEVVRRFLEHVVVRGFSPNTLCAYGYDLRHLFTFLKRERLG